VGPRRCLHGRVSLSPASLCCPCPCAGSLLPQLEAGREAGSSDCRQNGIGRPGRSGVIGRRAAEHAAHTDREATAVRAFRPDHGGHPHLPGPRSSPRARSARPPRSRHRACQASTAGPGRRNLPGPRIRPTPGAGRCLSVRPGRPERTRRHRVQAPHLGHTLRVRPGGPCAGTGPRVQDLLTEGPARGFARNSARSGPLLDTGCCRDQVNTLQCGGTRGLNDGVRM
jgi:hypothetical protein